MSEEPLFPARDEVDWSVLGDLYFRPHPLVNNAWVPPDPDPCHAGEMFFERRAVHHLLDQAGVPHGYSLDTRDTESRVLLLVLAFSRLRERLAVLGDDAAE